MEDFEIVDMGADADADREVDKKNKKKREKRKKPTGREKTNTKQIYLSFYTPSNMINVHNYAYLPQTASYRWLRNAWIYFLNCMLYVLKYLMMKSNELTIYVTKDANHPDCYYSHVELSTDEHTYVAKWGAEFTRIDGKLMSPEQYGSICIHLSPEDYEKVLKECERSTNGKYAFNYVGSVFNFVLPSFVRNVVFKNGYYERENACFCSEFVARSLYRTDAFFSIFEVKGLAPPMVSPIMLYVLIAEYSSLVTGGVTTSLAPLKRKAMTTTIIPLVK